MKRIKAKFKLLINTTVKSLTSFKYYKEVEKANFKFSLKYLFGLFYVLSLIGSLVFAVSISTLILPKISGIVSTFESKANSLYPLGLVVQIQNGKVSTNQKEPYFLDSINGFNFGGNFDHLLTIDSNANPSNIKDLKTAVLVTKDSIVTEEGNQNTYKVYPIDASTNMTIDQKGYANLISQISPYLKYIKPAIIVIAILSVLVWPFIVAALSVIGKLIYLLFFTAIMFILVKIMKKNLTFKKLYQLGIHASTLPILLGVIVTLFGIQMPFLLGSAILFVFMVLVLNQF